MGSTALSATNASFAAGQVILIHQSRGTNAGKWQKTKIAGYSTGTITTEDTLTISYVTGAQVLVIKQYTNVTVNVSVTWTAKAWNGTVGGILAFLCNGTLTVTGTISANGLAGAATTYTGGGGVGIGFSGGNGIRNTVTHYSLTGEGNIGAPAAQTTANGNGGGGAYVPEPSDGKRASGGGGGHAAAGAAGTGSSGGATVVGAAGAAVGQANLNTSMFFGGGGGGGANIDNNTSLTAGGGGGGGGILFFLVKTLSITGSVVSNGGAGATGTNNQSSGGGGSGGSVLIKCQTATLGTALITATAGAGGTGGGAGAVGRVHMDYLTSFTGTTNPTLDSLTDSTLTETPSGSSFTHIVGGSNGKIYSWDGASTYTELFDSRKITWYDTIANGDANLNFGGVSTWNAQGFKVAATGKVKAIQIYIRKYGGTPGDITVKIQTNNAGAPSGTLVSADATAIIPAFTTATYAWVTVEFPASFTLTAATLYHIVLSIPTTDSGNYYQWNTDDSSPSYADGSISTSTNAGTSWTAVSTSDALFRILGNSTSINTMMVSSLSGTKKLYFGTGDPASTSNGDARLFSYDGTNFVLVKTFNTTDEMCVLSMAEYGSLTTKAYIGLGAKAKVYVTSDFATFTLSKTITNPSNPGYVFCLKEYNKRLYAGGGYPEQLFGNNNQFLGFLYSYDEYSWEKIGSFEHTVVKSMEVYDNLLFIGTIKKQFYVYNTASIDKLLEFPWNVQMTSLFKFDDKLVIALAPTPGSAVSGHEGIYIFDRNGFHNAFNVASRSWYSMTVFNNNLMAGNDDGYIYQTSANTYQASGTLQTSYFEASLPGIDKKFRSLILQYESLPTGCSILAEYKTDEADASWTTIGTANVAASTQYEVNFSDTFYSKKISIRLTLATSVAASTPTLKVQDLRYVLMPDFKYLWKMKLACPDNIIWMDGTEPISTTTAASISAGATSLVLTNGTGFPTKGRAILTDGSTDDEFTWTGRTGNTLTGIPATGSLALSAHSSTGYTVKMTGKTLHNTILTMKQTKSLFAFVDIDEISYNVLFHQYQADNFVVNQTDGIENDVPITLLEA